LKLNVTSEIDKIPAETWDSFVNSHPYGSVLQSSFIHHVFEQSRNMTPVVIGCFDPDEVLQGILLAVIIREAGGLKGRFSSRTVVYGGPLVNELHKRKEQIVELLLGELIEKVKKKSIFIQFRALYELSDYQHIFRKLGFHWQPRLNLLIDTKDEKAVWKGVSSGRKRQIKKSLSNGAKIIEPENEDQIRAFYNILHNLYKYKVKKPLPHWTFFRSTYQLAARSSGSGVSVKFFLIEYENQIIGGILAPYLKGKAVYEWYVCGLDRHYKEKGIYPSVLATWAAIEFAAKNNFAEFDFMGVGIPDKPYGVRDFKRKFGGHQVNFGRYVRVNNRWFYVAAELGFNLLSLVKKI